jgi:serine/threonine-protein kinase RsbW
VTDTVRLTFPAKPDYLVLARLALAGIARAYPLEPELLADLKLAVTEACGNAVRHAYANEVGSVTVAYTVVDDRLELVVEDRGAGLSPLTSSDWPMPEDLEGGMGMAIIRAVVDELEVGEGSGGRGTVVRMTKYLTPASSAQI